MAKIAYCVIGIVIYLVMRMLGEMVVDEPVAGSFTYFANKYYGAFWGFLTGWNYWLCYIIVSMSELAAIGIYMNFWFPHLPHWVSALVCVILITLVNFSQVKLYGDIEFIMTVIKIAAIVCMIVLGFAILFTEYGSFPHDFHNLWSNHGFAPHGAWGIALSLVAVTFSFGGVELVGITAAEAENPKKIIPKAINGVMLQILFLYIVSYIMLAALYPWNEIGMKDSPFVLIFSHVGIPYTADILNFIILIASLSVYNSAMYSTSRMLYSLAQEGNAPRFLASLSKKGVPIKQTIVTSGITFLAVPLTYFFPQRTFMYLMAGAIISLIIAWFTIVIVNLRFRRMKEKAGIELDYKLGIYPFDNYLCILFLIFIVAMMTQIADMAIAVYLMPVWLLILVLGYVLKRKFIKI